MEVCVNIEQSVCEHNKVVGVRTFVPIQPAGRVATHQTVSKEGVCHIIDFMAGGLVGFQGHTGLSLFGNSQCIEESVETASDLRHPVFRVVVVIVSIPNVSVIAEK